jgi:ribosomal-protein-alanine N-acetyltransferase
MIISRVHSLNFTEQHLNLAMTVMDSAFDPFWSEAWTKEQLANSLKIPGTELYLAKQKDEVASSENLVSGLLLSRTLLTESEILLFAVKQNMQRKGLGREILGNFLNIANEQGTEDVFLEMRENNPAYDLYQSLGFLPVGRRTGYYTTQAGDKVDAITFRKRIL